MGPVAQSSGMAGQGGSRLQRDWLQVSPRLTAPRDGRQSWQSCRRLQRGWAGRPAAGDRRASQRGVAIAGSRWATRVAPLRRPGGQGTVRTESCRSSTTRPSTSSNAPSQRNPVAAPCVSRCASQPPSGEGSSRRSWGQLAPQLGARRGEGRRLAPSSGGRGAGATPGSAGGFLGA